MHNLPPYYETSNVSPNETLNILYTVLNRHILDNLYLCPFDTIQHNECSTCNFHNIRMCKLRQIQLIMGEE